LKENVGALKGKTRGWGHGLTVELKRERTGGKNEKDSGEGGKLVGRLLYIGGVRGSSFLRERMRESDRFQILQTKTGGGLLDKKRKKRSSHMETAGIDNNSVTETQQVKAIGQNG